MVLSNIEIRAEIEAERLSFDPPILSDSRFDSSSVDLLLHEELIELETADSISQSGVLVDPTTNGGDRFNVMKLLGSHGEVKNLGENGSVLLPNRLVIGKTEEFISLPRHIAGRIEGKSTLARVGLAVHVTAPTVIAGFKGRLFLEIHNVGPFRIVLKKGNCNFEMA